jgi:protein-serine/threonine kinase
MFLQKSTSDLSDSSLEEKYGKIDKHSLGKGANSVVRLAHKRELSMNGENIERLYAVKVFRNRHDTESQRDYIKKVTAEFCISSSLHHENVIETVDLIVCFMIMLI